MLLIGDYHISLAALLVALANTALLIVLLMDRREHK